MKIKYNIEFSLFSNKEGIDFVEDVMSKILELPIGQKEYYFIDTFGKKEGSFFDKVGSDNIGLDTESTRDNENSYDFFLTSNNHIPKILISNIINIVNNIVNNDKTIIYGRFYSEDMKNIGLFKVNKEGFFDVEKRTNIDVNNEYSLDELEIEFDKLEI